MYALERLFATSNQTGTDLKNFTALTGIASKSLQQYQWAAKQVGLSNEEMAGTFVSLQSSLEKITLGQGMPALMGLFAQAEGLDDNDIAAGAENPLLLFPKAQHYVDNEPNKALADEVMRATGFSNGVISAMRRHAFSPDILAKAPVISDKNIDQLAKNDAMWANLKAKIEMNFATFNAEHGGTLVKDITGIVDSVTALVEALEQLAEKAKLFKYLGEVFKGWEIILAGVTKGVDKLNDFDAQKKTSIELSDMQDTGDITRGLFVSFFKDMAAKIGIGKDETAPSVGPTVAPTEKAVMPNSPPPKNGAENTAPAQNININQSLNFQHDGKDAQQTADAAKRGVRSAFYDNGALAQVT